MAMAMAMRTSMGTGMTVIRNTSTGTPATTGTARGQARGARGAETAMRARPTAGTPRRPWTGLADMMRDTTALRVRARRGGPSPAGARAAGCSRRSSADGPAEGAGRGRQPAPVRALAEAVRRTRVGRRGGRRDAGRRAAWHARGPADAAGGAARDADQGPARRRAFR